VLNVPFLSYLHGIKLGAVEEDCLVSSTAQFSQHVVEASEEVDVLRDDQLFHGLLASNYTPDLSPTVRTHETKAARVVAAAIHPVGDARFSHGYTAQATAQSLPSGPLQGHLATVRM